MFFILTEKTALRSFWYVPYAYYVKDDCYAKGATKEEFEFLLKCDGNTELERSELSDSLMQKNLIRPCEKGEKLTKWQEYRECDNRYMPKMNIQITGRCNYNCIHCFNAKDNAPLQSEIPFDAMCHLLDECVDCGISSFTITGGEPMLHPQYRQIIEEIYKRGMFVFDLNTNGFYITQEMLDWMKSIGFDPLVKISFDGIGFHNWMRGYKKAEEKTLQAIKLCIDNGFKVKIQMNVNKKNMGSLVESCIMLDKMGVSEIRLIKTTNAPRWEANGKENTMNLNEYYDYSIDFLNEFYKEDRTADINFWMICQTESKGKTYTLAPIACRKGEYRDSLPLCKAARGMIAIGSNGNVYPCLQSSGYYENEGAVLGNIYKQSLREILQDSEYMKMVTMTVAERREASEICKACPHFEKCTGGCPALAILTSGQYYLADRSKCIFFNEKYDEKLRTVFEKYDFYGMN